MRCPKCHTETSAEALNCPSCNLSTPRGRFVNTEKGKADKARKPSQAASKIKVKTDWAALKPGKWINWVLLAGLFAALGFGVYWYIYSSPSPVKPESALTAMNELRKLPSKEEGKSIDDCLTAELKKSKDAGQLINYQGWTVKPYSKHTYLISFSFEDKNGKKSADWVVDPLNKTYTPITELATVVHKE
jgi:hypothetical protein